MVLSEAEVRGGGDGQDGKDRVTPLSRREGAVTRGGPGRRLGRSADALRPGPEVSSCPGVVELAMIVSAAALISGTRHSPSQGRHHQEPSGMQ